MTLFRKLAAVPMFVWTVGTLLASSGVIVVLSTNLVSNDSSTAVRWEPTSAAGTTWLHAWAEIGSGVNSFASCWNGSSWAAPQPLTAPNGLGTNDVNMNWDSGRARFVFVALDTPCSGCAHNVWYGYSTDSSGSSWVFGNSTQPIFSSGAADWDYPSVGVDSSGRVIAGAVKFLACPPPQTGECSYGYYSVISSDGTSFSSQYPIVSSLNSGAQSRVVATNDQFEAFVPTLTVINGSWLPTYIARYESSDGVNWNGDLGIGMGSFGAPNNNTPPGTFSIGPIFYAPLLAAQGYTNGLWTVAFQANNAGYNNVILCTSDRGCGWVNAAADDEFLVGTSVSGDSGYWVSYYAYQNPRNPPLITQAIYFAAGQSGIGATTNTGIDPTHWTTSQYRCPVTCYEAGDFHTVASNPYASSTTPFIQQGSGKQNDLFQGFVQDPQTVANVPNFKPNYIPISRGTDVTGMAAPVSSGAFALPPGVKIGVRVP